MRHVARVQNVRNRYIFVGMPEEKRPFGCCRHRLEDNIKMEYGEVNRIVECGWDTVAGPCEIDESEACYSIMWVLLMRNYYSDLSNMTSNTQTF